MHSFLLQPYPFGSSVPRKLATCAAVGLFVALFLGVFQPFGMHAFSARAQWLHPVLFGLVTFVVSSVCQVLLPRAMPRVFAEHGWKSWKEIVFLIFIVICIAAGNYALMEMLYDEPVGGRSFAKVFYITALVGIFPVVTIVAVKQMRLYRQYAADAAEVNQAIVAPEPREPVDDGTSTAATTIVLQGEGQKERLELAPGEILYVASADNYVEVFVRGEEDIRNHLLRCSLKKIEEQLSAQPSFLRCHRMFVVNLDAVERVSGNAQGLRLHLHGVEEPVPVSRSLTELVKERLSHLSRSPQLG
jgi:DNA-binding LytR/AlgR family response regulator